MKTKIKWMSIGMVIALGLSITIQSFASVALQNVQVAFDSLSVTVNGVTANAPNILYDGRTYVQMRTISEMLGKDVGWDGANRIATINDKAIEKPIECSKVNIKTEDGNTNAVGEVKNVDSKERNVKINIVFLANDESIIGIISAYEFGLQPGQTKTFETYNTKDYSGYKEYRVELE